MVAEFIPTPEICRKNDDGQPPPGCRLSLWHVDKYGQQLADLDFAEQPSKYLIHELGRAAFKRLGRSWRYRGELASIPARYLRLAARATARAKGRAQGVDRPLSVNRLGDRIKLDFGAEGASDVAATWMRRHGVCQERYDAGWTVSIESVSPELVRRGWIPAQYLREIA